MTDTEMQTQLNKAKILGLNVQEINCDNAEKMYIISKSKTEHTLLIPSTIKKVNGNNFSISNYLRDIRGKLKVIGGDGLENTWRMFYNCKINRLDLSNLNVSNVTIMSEMFRELETGDLDLSMLDTGSVTDMNSMFYSCKCASINLSGFNTSKVYSMVRMFSDFRIIYKDACGGLNYGNLDLGSFDTHNVSLMSRMFDNCQVNELIVSSFDTSKVINMRYMFNSCRAKEIDIRNFSDKSLKVVESMCNVLHTSILVGENTGEKIKEEYEEYLKLREYFGYYD